MDTLRGHFGSADFPDDSVDFDLGEDENIRDLPPAAIGQDERRMQVRAYNHWASMLGERTFPAVEELEPQNLDDFGPYSVLLDFSLGIEDPAVQFLGDELAAECGTQGRIERLSDVPARSLLSRITDHYMQILANQAPIGFEAEFVNQRGATIMYRGILLPFSSDDETIDFIYGVINWKEMADPQTADELLLEIDQTLDDADADADAASDMDDGALELGFDLEMPASDYSADLPISSIHPADRDEDLGDYELPTPKFGDFDITDYGDEGEEEEVDEANYDFASLTDHMELPAKKSKAINLEDLDKFSATLDPAIEPDVTFDMGDDWDVDDYAGAAFDAPESVSMDADPLADDAPLDLPVPELSAPDFSEPDFGTPEPAEDIAEIEPAIDAAEVAESAVAKSAKYTALESFGAHQGWGDDEQDIGAAELSDDAGLYDFLASARELAQAANNSEDRSRTALYAAVSRAYDVALASQETPEEYAELLAENGLTVQERAPMTPVVKLVFGADYDKTRLTEYAAVLSHARRLGLGRGQLSSFLYESDGGLKGVVQTERRLRREEAGKVVDPVDAVRPALAEKLRAIAPVELGDLPADGGEFALVMVRRTETGELVVLGEIEQDIALIERAARKLVG